jgi:gas vesicle protein
MTTRNKILLGIVGAAAVGVLAGMLLAPEKGKDFRKKIKRTAGDWADNLSHLWSNGKKTAENMAEEIRDKSRRARAATEE